MCGCEYIVGHDNNYIEYDGNGDRNKNLSIEENLSKIQPSLKDIIELQKWNIRKTKLKIRINFISSKDTNKERTMHSKSDNIEVLTYENLHEIIEELSDLLFSRY